MDQELVEICLRVRDIDATLHFYTELFDFEVASRKDGENNLEMVHTLNELKDSFDELTRVYQQLLLKTTDAALHAVDTMKETDETLAQAMGS